MAVEVQPAAAGLAPTGVVGDLHVAGDVGVPRDRAVHIVAVVGQVEQVAEEPDVLVSGRPDRVDHRHGIVGRAQRVGLGAAHRLDEHGGADLGCRVGGAPEVVAGELVLLGRRDPVDPVAVQRVERRHFELLADADRDVEVVTELRRAVRDRQHAGVGAGEVAREEVQPDQPNAGVANRAHEGVDLRIAGHRLLRPWPPELDRVKAGGPSGGGALQQRPSR